MTLDGNIYILLNEQPLEKHRQFARELGKLNLTNGKYAFDYLDCKESISRQNDKGMTLDKYFKSFPKASGFKHIVMQVFYTDSNPNISFSMSYDNFFYRTIGNKKIPLKSVSKFLWHYCDATPENLEHVTKLFEKTYNKKFKDTRG